MSIFKPIETVSSKLESIPVKHGQYIYCSDTGEIFIDNSMGERVSTNKSISIKKGTTTLTADSNSVGINIEGFNAETDTLLVYLNSVYLDEGTDYNINKENNNIECIDGYWKSTENDLSIFNFVAFCNAPTTTILSSPIQPLNLISQTPVVNNNEMVILKYENALMVYTLMINNLNVSNLVTEDKILYFYINSLWTKEMVYEAIEHGLLKKEKFEQIL